jgi:hypothetical protein
MNLKSFTLVAFLLLAITNASLSTRSRPLILRGIRNASTKSQTEFSSNQLSAKEFLATATGLVAFSYALAKYCPPPVTKLTEKYEPQPSIWTRRHVVSAPLRLVNYLAWQKAEKLLEEFLESAKKSETYNYEGEEECKEKDEASDSDKSGDEKASEGNL